MDWCLARGVGRQDHDFHATVRSVGPPFDETGQESTRVPWREEDLPLFRSGTSGGFRLPPHNGWEYRDTNARTIRLRRCCLAEVDYVAQQMDSFACQVRTAARDFIHWGLQLHGKSGEREVIVEIHNRGSAREVRWHQGSARANQGRWWFRREQRIFGINNMVSLLALCYLPNETNHILCPGCLGKTPRNISICLLCMGKLKSHGTIIKRKVKTEMDHDGDAKNVPSASGVKTEDAEGIPEADNSDDVVPDEPEADEPEAKDDDAKGDAKMDDDGDVAMGEAPTSKFDEEAKEDVIQGEEDTFKMSDGAVLTTSALNIPKWMTEWALGTKAMSVEEANSLESFPRAGEIIDGMIGGWIHRNYNLHIIDLVSRSHQSRGADHNGSIELAIKMGNSSRPYWKMAWYGLVSVKMKMGTPRNQLMMNYGTSIEMGKAGQKTWQSPWWFRGLQARLRRCQDLAGDYHQTFHQLRVDHSRHQTRTGRVARWKRHDESCEDSTHGDPLGMRSGAVWLGRTCNITVARSDVQSLEPSQCQQLYLLSTWGNFQQREVPEPTCHCPCFEVWRSPDRSPVHDPGPELQDWVEPCFQEQMRKGINRGEYWTGNGSRMGSTPRWRFAQIDRRRTVDLSQNERVHYTFFQTEDLEVGYQRWATPRWWLSTERESERGIVAFVSPNWIHFVFLNPFYGMYRATHDSYQFVSGVRLALRAPKMGGVSR